MVNFCTNCGNELRKEDNFCPNCGAEIRKENSFCTVCGNELRKEDNFCTNCGAKIDKSDTKQDNDLLKTVHDSAEKEKIRKAKEKEKKNMKKAKITKRKEVTNKKTEENITIRGGYCSLNCRHCYEELLDSGGGIVGDYEIDGNVEYYCSLGHSISYGSFCEDYE